MIEPPPALPNSADAAISRPAWNRIFNVLGPFLALAAVVLFFAIADQWKNGEKATFVSARNLMTISSQTATVAVAALGMTIIIIAGGIDLSAGTAIALSATLLAWCLKEDVGLPLVRQQTDFNTREKLSEARRDLANTRSKLSRPEKRLTEVRQQIEAMTKGESAPQKKPDVPASQADVAKLKQLAEEADQLQAEVHPLVAEVQRLDSGIAPVRFASAAIGLIVALGTGGLCGMLNGVLVSYLRVVPFIVSLGTMQVYLGLAKKVASETTVRPDRSQVPNWFVDLLSVRADALWLGLPSGVWLTLLLAGLLAAVLHWTVFSRYVFALGSNEATARLCGINVRWNKIAVYTLGGLFVGIAGLYQFSRLTVGNPTSGTGLELRVIAAVVIGGASLSGGRGSVLGTLLGAVIMSVIANGCTMLDLQNPVQDIILGVIIVAAVTLDQFRQRTVGGRQ